MEGNKTTTASTLTEIEAVHSGFTQWPHVRTVRVALPKEAPQHDSSTTSIRRVNERQGAITARTTADAEEDLLAARLACLHLLAELWARGQPRGMPVVVGVLGGAGGAEVDDGKPIGGFEAVDVAEDDGVDGLIGAQLGE